MFNSRAKYLNNIFTFVKRAILAFFVLVLSVLLLLHIFGIINIIPDFLYGNAIHNKVDNPFIRLLTTTLFFSNVFSIGLLPLFIFEKILKNKCIRIFNNECLEIINMTELPKKLPKVLYIYTTHNDFIEARVLQNMKQSYKNFELWVSDGSTKLEWRNKIKNFCEQNNINLFQLDEKGSKNKADNLNQFLKNYKGDYDYLLIGDSDEVFHPNFVEGALKLFYSEKITDLGFVTPFNIPYRSKGIYPNTSRILESKSFYGRLYKNFNLSNIPPLAGQSCLISKKYLLECNQFLAFDNGNLEDWYLESSMVENLFFGILLPCFPCYYEPDINVKVNFNRIGRVQSWIIRWWKIRIKKIIWNHTSKYTNWYNSFLIYLFLPIYIFLGIGLLSVLIWVIINWYSYAFEGNILFWIFVSSLICYFLLYITIDWFYTRYFINNLKDLLIFSLFFIMWIFVAAIKVTQFWFKSLIIGKYPDFNGSGSSRFLKMKMKKINWWIWLIFLSILISVFNSLIFNLVNWSNIKWLIIIFNCYFGTFWMGCFSYLALWYINFIPYNKNFNREDWIDCKDFLIK